MEFTSENIAIQRQYRKGFAIKKEIKKESPSTDITKEKWFWDMAVIS